MTALIQCPPLLLAPLVNMSKAAVKINLHCLSFLSFIQKFTKFQPIIEVKQWKWGKISLWNKCFHYFMLATIIGTQLLQHPFPAQQLWVFSYNAWRVWRTPDKRSETISSYRISQILQIHSSMLILLLFSSPHSFSTGFRSEDGNGHSRSLVLCSVTHFCVVFEVCVCIIVRLEDPNMAHYKISNRVSHLLIFYLLVFNRIHDAVCLNKMFRTSSRK